MKFIVGLGQGNHEYKIHGVKYVVTPKFQNAKIKENLSFFECMKKVIKNNFTPLKQYTEIDIMTVGNACSTVGKED